jgi:hypothetical protein
LPDFLLATQWLLVSEPVNPCFPISELALSDSLIPSVLSGFPDSSLKFALEANPSKQSHKAILNRGPDRSVLKALHKYYNGIFADILGNPDDDSEAIRLQIKQNALRLRSVVHILSFGNHEFDQAVEYLRVSLSDLCDE